MACLRRNLRVFVTTWLMFQVAWLTALVPRNCCAAHRPAEKSCHESAAATHCPMRDATGRPCPMHRGHAGHDSPEPDPAEHHHQTLGSAHHTQTPSAPSSDCRLSGVCDGPMAALFALLSNHGILPEATEALPSVAARQVAPPVHESLTGRFEQPDSPPPRA